MNQSKKKHCNVCNGLFTPFKTTQKSCCYGCHKQHEDSKPKKPKKKVKLIAPISKKLASRLVIYRIRRDAYMKTNTICECSGCCLPSQDLHHKAGRLGDNLINEKHFMAVCRKCHNWIHEHPKESRELKYLK